MVKIARSTIVGSQDQILEGLIDYFRIKVKELTQSPLVNAILINDPL